ncbi:MAG: GNAT family N-acetyltransferase [Bacteroidota bacterium]
MNILKSEKEDIPFIMELYRMAAAYMKTKNQVVWPEFPLDLVETEIAENRQWKLIIENEIACIWAIAFQDPLIWGPENNEPSVYIHRIATNPNFRGQNLVGNLVQWADAYCLENNLKFVRLDTVGHNHALIAHYQKQGFEFLGARDLPNTEELPEHYSKGPACLFQRAVKR